MPKFTCPEFQWLKNGIHFVGFLVGQTQDFNFDEYFRSSILDQDFHFSSCDGLEKCCSFQYFGSAGWQIFVKEGVFLAEKNISILILLFSNHHLLPNGCRHSGAEFQILRSIVQTDSVPYYLAFQT